MATFGTRATAWVIGVAVLLGVAHARVDASETEVPARTPMEAAEELAGGVAERCVFGAPGVQICSWPLEGRLIGERSDGETPFALNLICEVAIEALGGVPDYPLGYDDGAPDEDIWDMSIEVPEQPEAPSK